MPFLIRLTDPGARLSLMMRLKLGMVLGITLGISGTLSGCVSGYTQSVGGETAKVFERIYLTDFNTAWQAVLDALKNSRLDITNKEGGIIQTNWTDNTAEKNFSDSFGNTGDYLKAQYRFRVTISRGFYNGRPTIKVSTIKEQLIQKDVLDGWRTSPTDSTDENTLLYRIGRIIFLKMKIAKYEDDKSKRELEKAGF